MSNKVKLKRCPFCGGEAILDFRTVLFSLPLDFFVKCTQCGIHTNDYAISDHAIDAWNWRVHS